MSNNIITAAFANSDITYTRPAYQYDYGMILKFSGIDLPQAYEVHFSNTEFCGESISQIGNSDGVTIPDEMFLSGNPIYAWTYLHTGEDDGETVYKAVIGVNKRAKPSDLEPTPVQQDAITQAIAALNVAVEQTAADVVAAGESAEAAASSAETAGQAKDDAVEAQGKAEDAQKAAENAQEAAETAQGKAEDAQEAAEQAAGAVLGLTADASVDANTGTPSVEVNVSTVSDHKNMSFSFHNLKGDPGDPGEPGDDGFSPVVSVSSITGGHEVAVTDKNGTQTFDVMDGTDGQDGVSPTVTVTEISGGHNVEITDAQGTTDFDVMDGEVSEEQLETALIDKADIIISSASGEIVTIQDGAKNLPVKNLSVSLLPIQDLHGYDNPWPAGGGKNKINAPDITLQSAGYIYNGALSLPAGTYTMSFSGAVNSASFAIVDGDGNAMVSGSHVVPYTFTIPSDAVSARFYVASGGTYSNIQIESGSSATAYAPYSNVCPISGWTGVEVYQKGFNVWDEEWEEGEINSSTGQNSNSGNYWRSKNYIPVLPGVAYTAYSPTASNKYIRARFYDANKNYIGYSAKSGDTQTDHVFVLPDNCYFMRIAPEKTALPNHDVCINISGSRNGTYESYKGKPTIPIDWTSSAGTVYGGSLDLTTGVLTDEMGILTLDSNIPSGTAGFRNLAVLADGVRCEYYPYRAIGQGNSARVYSDRFANRDASTGTPYSIITNIGDPRLLVCLPAEYNTVDKFLAYFASNPLDIYYYKQTPTTYQLDPVQIQTLLGNNSFWSNGNGTLDLEYRADTKLYIENLTKPSEDDMTANANIASGKFFMIGNRLMLSTTAIAQGEQIVVGTNCSEVSLADALNQINA